ncbi:hypothetical protein SS1G_09016 [Sclerotinia sclerotiorum 1980 UF-70]|uniref:GTPase-activating protein GYP7 n=1 Tax=Sclerotinia sclerotiorum (strain ATCC 18683 / 1980 / Ss-1) TaxID=665079 RepID=A7EUK9_SCLS1|nr:hypothetical protein SS1G_09016 [Sclerotinia sclerotiorum 1980 UF-70]EDN93151.1 hypothetical protein SS1G_09016 [Sclerotinia sclerotiorum 1980 UF-70]
MPSFADQPEEVKTRERKRTRYVMNDLAAIEKYKTRPYIAEWPYMRYYAEVPIYSPENIVIGTYCVVDNKPRYEGLDDDGLEILNEIARAIMRHLVLIEKQDHLERGEKMVKGLGFFVAGKSNLGEEALRDTSTGDEQDDMIRSITICGEVLLDTMDHILDYAKIANKGETKDMKDLPVQSNGPNTNFDLSNLIETVVEGVSAAQSFRQLTFEGPLSIDTNGLDMNFNENGLSDSVVIILEIDWQTSWAFNSQISSWRRIFINLFQNALKYTEFGYVHVRLTAHQSIDGPVVKLSIIDSGKGISNDYLKYELWTPFVQEDPMSIGTGLGLSIVGKLVQELDGTIDILSTVGTGTAVQVEIPVEHSIPSDEDEETESNKLIRETRERCRGLSMCLLGLDNYPDPCEIPTDAPSAKERRMTAIKSALINYAGDWFGMVIRKACSGFCTDGVIFVCLKSQLQYADRTRHKPLIVFEDNMGISNKEEGVFYLTQPAGPFKLARILGQCIDYLHSVGFLPNIIERSSMSSRVPSSTGSPLLLTPPANGYPDSKNIEACRKSVNDEGRPSLDSRQNSSESTESARPKFDSRKHSSESTDSAVDMRTSEESIVTYHSFPFPAALPPRLRNESEVHRLDNLEKSNGEPVVLDKTGFSKTTANSDRVTDLEKSLSVLQKPIVSDENILLEASPALEKLAVVEKPIAIEKATIVEKAPITQDATICEKPIVPEKPAVLQIVESEPSITPTTKKSARTVILLVEDNVINLKVLVHSMKKLKEEYDTASNGLQAFEKYKKAPEIFKIIIMDISMPIMDGLTSTRHIREYESTHGLSRVRIVALTCFGTEEHRRDAAMSGVDLFLTKPIHLKSLKPVVDLDPEGVKGGVMGESSFNAIPLCEQTGMSRAHREFRARTDTASGAVYIHPTPSAKDNIPGYIALLQQKPPPDSRPTSSSSKDAKSRTAASLLLAWLPESSLGDALNTYVKVDLSEGDSPPRQSYLVPPPPTTTTHSGSIGHYAFAIPVSQIYSLLVRPPSLGWWFGSVVINSRAGDSFPALFFHDSECQSTILQKKKRTRESFDPFGANGEMFWGGDEVLRWLRRYVEIERSGAEPNIYLVEPSAEDKEAFGDKPVTSAPVRSPTSSGARVGGAAGASSSTYRSAQRDAGMDPVTKFVKEAGWNLMEKFSKVTTFTRRTADSIVENPKIPPQVRRFMKNPEVQTIQEEFDSARIYLARWAMGIAEQSERDRNQRIWTARDVLEMEETDVGDFELLETEMGSLTMKEQRKTVTLREWNKFFDQRSGRLSVTVDEVKERIFHGGLDPDDGVRKEAWLFLLGVYEWDSSADERKAVIAALRDEYVKLKDMLLTYNEYNRDLGYVQGMSDLLAPIYAVMQDDAIAFWGFQHFMERMERNFLRDQSGMRSQLLTLDHLVQLMDPKLYLHLRSADSTNFFFFFRMLLVWYKREFAWLDVLHLWEVLWTDYLSSGFHLFIALAILEKHRDVIMTHLQHFDEVLKYVNELSNQIDLESTLVRAEALFRRFQRTVEAIDRKSSFPKPSIRHRGTQSTSQVSEPSNSSGATSGADTGSGQIEGARRDKGKKPNGELEVSEKPKVISKELRDLLSRKVVVLPRKLVRREGEGLAKVQK